MGTAIHSAFAPCIPVHAMALGASLLDTMAHHPAPSNAGEGLKKPNAEYGVFMQAEARTAQVNIRITLAEMETLRVNASTAGMTVSEYVRRRALGHTITAQSDVAVLKELRRLGGQIKYIYTQGGETLSQDTAGALHAVENYARSLKMELARGRQKN